MSPKRTGEQLKAKDNHNRKFPFARRFTATQLDEPHNMAYTILEGRPIRSRLEMQRCFYRAGKE